MNRPRSPAGPAQRPTVKGAPSPARAVCEEPPGGSVPLYVHPEWAESFPWLVQGTTGRGAGDDPFDLRLFGSQSAGTVLDRWRLLREAVGCQRGVHARQVHGTALLVHESGPPGLLVAERYDAHATRTAGVLITVSVADCVPISLVDADRRAIALLHGGWRGIAAGVLREGAAALERLAGSAAHDLWVHFGPAICGDCYEVGPEVHEALGLDVPSGRAPVDLRAVLAAQAAALGIKAERTTTSALCTLCAGAPSAPDATAVARPAPFFSHRAGCAARQVGVLGIRPSDREHGSRSRAC